MYVYLKNNNLPLSLFLIFILYNFLSCSDSHPPPSTINTDSTVIVTGIDADSINRSIGKGINLGNALEAPDEGDFGVFLKEDYFELIYQAGFQSIRIPIRWSAHCLISYPYTIDTVFFKRVDWAVNQTLSRTMIAIINIHNFEEIMNEPELRLNQLLSLWKQIAEHYKNYPATLVFELLNEPMNKLNKELWNKYLVQLLDTIRQTNFHRTIIIGGINWNSINSIKDLVLPPQDRHLIVTFHYYNPFAFTHQGAEWVTESNEWLGTSWIGTSAEKDAILNELNEAETWALSQNRPLFIGEFGSYNKAELNSRVRWTRFLAREAEKRNISWSYWEFCSGFGVYDPTSLTWNSTLLNALIPSADSQLGAIYRRF